MGEARRGGGLQHVGHDDLIALAAAAFEQSGCDELILIPSSSGLEQVALLAEAVK